MTASKYVPMNKLVYDKETPWVFTSVNLPYEEIAKKGIVLWCHENLQCKWTMLGGSKFGFESGEEAVVFKFQFGL